VPNLFDKTIGYFSPKYAFESAQFRNAEALLLRGNLYDGAKQGSHYDISFLETTDDEDIADLPTLRTTSRAKYRNNGFYRGVIACATDHTIGSGLKAKSTIKNRLVPHLSPKRIKEVEAMFDDYFNSWANSTICDITAKDNFYMMQRLAYKVYKRDGDSFAALPLSNIASQKILQIDLLGAETITSTNKEFTEGIKVSKNKMPLIYSIKQSNGSYKEIRAFKSGKKNILHIFDRERTKQIRGIPFLTPVMRDVDAIDDYMKHEMGAAKLSAIFFGSVTTPAGTSTFGDTTNLLNGDQKQTEKNTVKENSITELSPGDKLDIHGKGRENPNFDKYIMTNLKKVSTSTRIPLEIILAQFVSSYSASRAALLQMKKFTDPERMIFNNSFNKPIREQVITWGILNGDLDVRDFFEYRSAYLESIWIGDPVGSVDPLKDVNAKLKAIAGDLGTHEQSTFELGNGDFETNVSILEKELTLLVKIKKLRNEVINDNN